ncbi:Protein T20D4.7 [Aphelenchoides avenae]|nr:Protein T20D4.7 [Aphelenchus avenae]
MGETIDWKTISLAKKDGSKVEAEEGLKGKLVGLYFSAHWCGPCRWFTPNLKKFYDAVKDSENFEIVFVSRDNSAEEMKAYMEECHGDWLHVPYDQEVSSSLSEKYNESGGIPELVIFDEAGNNLRIDGYGDVATQYKEEDNDEEEEDEVETEASKCKSPKEVVALWRSKAKR